MTIEKAIETLEYHEPSLTYDENPDIRLALQLGIEALKRILDQKTDFAPGPFGLLPGETE